MDFSQFSQVLEKLEATASRLEITKILANLLSKLKPKEISGAVFLSLGSLGPKYDNPNFGLSEKLMIRSLARSSNKSDAEVLRFFKNRGDLGLVAQDLPNRNTQKQKIKSLDIMDVFNQLSRIANSSGAGSQEDKISLMSRLIEGLNGSSKRYLVRIPLGTMRLGFSEKTILEALTLLESGQKDASFAKDSASRKIKEVLEEKYHIYPNIGEIARVFKSEGLKGLSEIKLKVGVPVLAQLCGRVDTAEEMIKKMGKVVLEYKYDGTRIQAHLDRREGVFRLKTKPQLELEGFGHYRRGLKMYTRNLEEVGSMFPDLVDSLLDSVRGNQVILDGEAVGFDPKTGKFLPFQETIQRKRKYNIEEIAKKIPLKYFVFDKDGQDLTLLPLWQRRQILEKTVKEEGKILLTKEVVTRDSAVLQDYFKEAKDKGLEGLIAKKYDGCYEAGNRGFNWVKFKREETGGLEDSLDCVVLGYYKGAGKRVSFGIGAFLVGIYDEPKEKFVTIAKIGTGLTDEEWRELKLKIQNSKLKTLPKDVEIPKDLMPDVICDPKIVVVIRADEISLSPIHSSGYALRFPRMMGYRPDKTARQASNLKEIEDLFKLQRKA